MGGLIVHVCCILCLGALGHIEEKHNEIVRNKGFIGINF